MRAVRDGPDVRHHEPLDTHKIHKILRVVNPNQEVVVGRCFPFIACLAAEWWNMVEPV
jgi:hypothetical protein